MGRRESESLPVGDGYTAIGGREYWSEAYERRDLRTSFLALIGSAWFGFGCTCRIVVSSGVWMWAAGIARRES